MNPWIDVAQVALIIGCLIFLRYEIPRALVEIEDILNDAKLERTKQALKERRKL